MWITEQVAGARELFARWAGVLDFQQPPLVPASKRPTQTDAQPPPPIGILGVPFEPLTFSAALARVDAMIESGEPHYLATANVDFLIQARHDVELQRVLNQAALVVCDGTPILWLSRFFGNPLPERVAGSDLTPLLIERAAEKGYRIFFLGGHPEVASAAVSRLQEQYPNLVIAGHYSPPFRPLLEMNHDEIVARLRETKPDIVFVSFGCPKAEKWMAMNYRKAGVPVMIGVGATIDFLAGRVKRAPKWMQNSGTEWLYRLAQEPGRLFRRYARDLAELGFNVTGQWWHCRPTRRAAAANAILVDDPTWLQLRLPARLDHAAVCRDSRVWQRITGKDCLVQMRGVKCIDSTGMALLTRLHHRLSAQGKNLILLAPNRRVLRTLHWLRTDSPFLVAKDVQDAELLLERLRNEASEPVVESAIDWTLPLNWRGEITWSNADLVWERTHEYLSMCSTRRTHTAIDLKQVRFLDSSALAVMLRSRAYAQELGLQLNFTGVSAPLRRLIRLTGIERQLLRRYKVMATAAPAGALAAARIPVPAV